MSYNSVSTFSYYLDILPAPDSCSFNLLHTNLESLPKWFYIHFSLAISMVFPPCVSISPISTLPILQGLIQAFHVPQTLPWSPRICNTSFFWISIEVISILFFLAIGIYCWVSFIFFLWMKKKFYPNFDIYFIHVHIFWWHHN